MIKFILPFLLFSNLCFCQVSWEKFGAPIRPGFIETALVFTSQNILLGTKTQGVLYSEDGGGSWISINTGLPEGATITAFCFFNNKLVTVANGIVYLTNSNLSSPTSLTWSEFNNSSPSLTDANLIFADINETTLWCFSKNRAFKTTATSTSWTETPLPGVYGISSVNMDGNGMPAIAWARGTAQYHINTWQISDLSGSLLQDKNCQAFNVLKFDFQAGGFYGTSNGLFNFSSTMTNMSFDLPTVAYSSSLVAPTSINDIAVANGDLFVATQDVSMSQKGGNIYKLPKGTTSWIKLGNGLPQDIDKYTQVISKKIPLGHRLYAIGSAGMYMSSDAGESWNLFSQTIPINDGIKSFTFLNDGSIAAATETGKIFLGNSSGTSWVDISSSTMSGNIGHLRSDANNTIYASSGFAPTDMSSAAAGVFYTKDLGNTWVKAFPANRANSMDITIIPENEIFFGGNSDPAPHGKTIQFSSDGGNTWNVISVNGGSAGSIYAANKINGGTLLAASETSGVLRSTDGGKTFVTIGNTTGKSGKARRLDIAPWGDLFITFDSAAGMYIVPSSSLNSSNPTATQLVDFPALTNTSDVVFGNVGSVYVATDKGFYWSSDNGATFDSGNSGLKKQPIHRLAINTMDGHLYLANSEGLFKSSLPVVAPVIVKSDQTITFNPIDKKSFGDPAFKLEASSTSGLPISFASSNTDVITINGNTASIVGAGTAKIIVSQNGDENYNAAPDVEQTIIISKANQTLDFAIPATKKVGDAPFEIVGTSTSGLPLSYSSSDPNVAAVSGNTVTITSAGRTEITAFQPGDANYNAATSVIRTLHVVSDQLINFDSILTKTFGDLPFTLNATASSGLPIVYQSSNPKVAAIDGNVVYIFGAGSTNITASQEGNADFHPATRMRLLKVDKATQEITFADLIPRNVGDSPFALIATSMSGLPITFSSSDTTVAKVKENILTVIKVGTSQITANQPGDANYHATSVSRTLVVTEVPKADQVILFDELDNRTFGDLPFTLNATASSGLPIVYQSSNPQVAAIDGNVVYIFSAGSTNITAMQNGNEDFNPATQTRSLIVDKAKQEITFTSLLAKTVGDSPFSLSATSTSGLPVSFSSSDTTVATVSNNIVTILNSGTTELTASQIGDLNFLAAEDVAQRLTVNVITDIESSESMTLFPNPVTATTILSFENSTHSSDYIVYNLYGTEIHIPSRNISASQLELDFSGLADGLYFLKIISATNASIMKIMKR